MTGCPDVCDRNYPPSEDEEWRPFARRYFSVLSSEMDDVLRVIPQLFKEPPPHMKFIQQQEDRKMRGRPK